MAEEHVLQERPTNKEQKTDVANIYSGARKGVKGCIQTPADHQLRVLQKYTR